MTTLTKQQQDIENMIMAHRYLYYVEAQPVISDYAYDHLERDARQLLPESSPVHGVGSSLASSYTDEQKALAGRWMVCYP